jgi:hypothetical protein
MIRHCKLLETGRRRLYHFAKNIFIAPKSIVQA